MDNKWAALNEKVKKKEKEMKKKEQEIRERDRLLKEEQRRLMDHEMKSEKFDIELDKVSRQKSYYDEEQSEDNDKTPNLLSKAQIRK